ncbi:methyl-accepting chemotaxis protein [Gloeocapsa sp. PCC 73106]|uniref:methyl-accepting chemotaxis protein n=1 Tax=Gloeocapsa sp. PCC 73106 TaxID=102232 RepID=UPI0002ABE46E|nr:HAMP domain-containing methyl-accepting chemotaxis protein [Gloeocapsa sp. PCC 73106]ELR97570.1 methyl-accepting chemotaxis protein [Gloeocapsa sp. PCC 73106]
MTITKKNPVESNSEINSQDHDNSASHLSNDRKDQIRKIPKRSGTLRNRLLMTLLPTLLIPLAVANGIAVNVINRDIKGGKLQEQEKTVIITGHITSQFFQAVQNVNNVLEVNPIILDSLKSGTQKVQSEGLLQKSIDEVEQQFATTKLLSLNQALNNYLQTLAEENNIAEIIITERNGFNVGYNSPSSDFVQSDEEWWQTAQQKGATILEPKFDESSNSAVLELVAPIRYLKTGELLGVGKFGVSIKHLNERLASIVGVKLIGSQTIQIIDSKTARSLNTMTAEETTELTEIIGGQEVVEILRMFSEAARNRDTELENLGELQGISNVELTKFNEDEIVMFFENGERYFHVINIPATNLVAITSIEKAQVAAQRNQLIIILGSTALLLAGLATGIIFLLSQKLSQPLANLASKAQQVANGDLEVEANLEGTQETQFLAENFNNLVKQLKILIQEQRNFGQEKEQQTKALEQEIYQLLNEVEGALDGDLTVRASLTSIEMSTVADLFNAIIDNLKDIAVKVKDSTTQVSSSLEADQLLIQKLAEQAIEEVEATHHTLESVKEMSNSIEDIAENANRTAVLAQDTHTVTQQGASLMDETVDSILNLRTTIGDTAKKMKRLGESSQKISYVVSLIEEMALKTNLLAINASVEAHRAGEQGEGFRIVAEQVSALAEQSSTAAQQITTIVKEIQLENQEVSKTMEIGITQVVNSTNLVESTKQNLKKVLELSESINNLMQSISKTTVSQTIISHTVRELMERIVQQSKQRLAYTQKVTQSMETTAEVSQELELAVRQFKVKD